MCRWRKVGGKGLFTKEIEEALLAGTIDLAVHSLKDMPTGLPAGLTLAAIPEREDPRDALIGKALSELGAGSRVGTSSLRRAAQLHALGRGLVIENLRGNVDTRLRKLDEGQYDAIVLAAAGLRRLGWADRIRELIEPAIMCPAVGQGALAIETRDDGGAAYKIACKLDHAATKVAVDCRTVFAGNFGGWMPGSNRSARAFRRLRAASDRNGGVARRHALMRDDLSGTGDPAALGRELGERMLAAGARDILGS